MLSRRNAFRALAFSGIGAAGAVSAVDEPLTAGQVRGAAALVGLDLDEERLRILLPVLENRRRQLRELRAIPIGGHAGIDLPDSL